MRMFWRMAGCAAAITAAFPVTVRAQGVTVTASTYRGMCDASGAVALDKTRFIVANNEDSVLRIYSLGVPDPVIKDIHGLLNVDSSTKQTDLEGAARIGDTIFWITSHGGTKEDRRRLVAMTIDAAGAVSPVGKAYENLLDDLRKAPELKEHDLDGAAERDPESPGALNIEGLAAGPDGSLLIGFRNPIRNEKALVAKLTNPTEVVTESKPARFEKASPLPLGNRGIRSIEAMPSGGYVIVAGPYDGEGTFALYRWSGETNAQPTEIPLPPAALQGIHPEVVFTFPGVPNTLMLLSDDGDEKVTVGNQTKRCKKFEDAPEHQSFRARLITFP